jgi:tetratricopeptide (TPR) repeat protein
MVLAIFGVLAYSNTFNVPFHFDDTANLEANPVIQNFNFDSIMAAFQSRRAIGLITFQLNYFFAGWNVFWFHLTNLSIHISASLILYYLLTLMMQTPYVVRSGGEELSDVPLPFFVALIFVLHPLQTQAVTYIVQRFASLATLIYLAATVAYLRMRLVQVAKRHLFAVTAIGWFALFILLSLSAFLTKEIAYTLPMAIILIELLFFSHRKEKIVRICVLTAVFGALTFLTYLASGRKLVAVFSSLDEATRVQTITSRSDYLFTQFRVITTYIRLLLLPINQSIDYDYTLSHSLFEGRVLLSLLLLLLLILIAVWMVLKSRGANPLLRFAAFGIFWFFLTLSVESSFLPIIDLIFEHRVYLPSAGAITAFTAGVLMFWRGGELVRQRLCFAFLTVALVLGVTTWKRNSVWHSEISLWEDATGKYPNSARGWNNLGGAYIKERHPLEALKALTRSIELDPSKADAWNNIGIAIDLLGVHNDRFHRTSEMFGDPSAVEDKVVNSWLGEVNNNLGLAYEILGNLPKAAENYRNAVGYNPSLSIAYYNLGLVSILVGDLGKYSEQKQILMMIDPVLAERLQLRTGVR